jgi:hypothetical protein
VSPGIALRRKEAVTEERLEAPSDKALAIVGSVVLEDMLDVLGVDD